METQKDRTVLATVLTLFRRDASRLLFVHLDRGVALRSIPVTVDSAYLVSPAIHSQPCEVLNMPVDSKIPLLRAALRHPCSLWDFVDPPENPGPSGNQPDGPTCRRNPMPSGIRLEDTAFAGRRSRCKIRDPRNDGRVRRTNLRGHSQTEPLPANQERKPEVTYRFMLECRRG